MAATLQIDEALGPSGQVLNVPFAALGGWHAYSALEGARRRNDLGSLLSLHPSRPAPESLVDPSAVLASSAHYGSPPDLVPARASSNPPDEPQPLASLGPSSELAAALHHGGLCWEAMAAQHSATALLQGRRAVPMPGAPHRAARLLSLQLQQQHQQQQQHPLSWMTQLPAMLTKAGADALGASSFQASAAAPASAAAAAAARLETLAAASARSTARRAEPAQQRGRFWRRQQRPLPPQPLAEARAPSESTAAAAVAAAGAPTAMHQVALVMAGAVSRTLAQVAIHPLDTLKTRMQVSLPTPQLQVWRAVMGCPATRGRALAAWAGPAGARDLFLGLGGTLVGVLPASALYFGAEAAVRGWMAEALQLDRESAPCRLVASAAAATLSAFIRVPADVVKHRVQAYAYPSVARAARDILAARGPGGLYAGFSATLLRDAPEIVIQFTAYSTLKRLLQERRDAVLAGGAAVGGTAAGGCTAAGGGGFAEHVMLGGAAGAAAALATTPLDVVKTQMQCGAAGSVGAAVAGALRAGGPAALFSGLAPRLLQTTLCSAIFFTCFEASKARLAAAEAERAAKAAAPAAPARVAMAAPVPAAAVAAGWKQHLRRRRRTTSDPAPLLEELDVEAASWGLWEHRAELA